MFLCGSDPIDGISLHDQLKSVHILKTGKKIKGLPSQILEKSLKCISNSNVIELYVNRILYDGKVLNEILSAGNLHTLHIADSPSVRGLNWSIIPIKNTLRNLNLTGIKIGNSGSLHWIQDTNLEKLNLSKVYFNKHVYPQTFKDFACGLHALYFSNNSTAHIPFMKDIFKDWNTHFPNLSELDISHNYFSSLSSFNEFLALTTSLRRLDILTGSVCMLGMFTLIPGLEANTSVVHVDTDCKDQPKNLCERIDRLMERNRSSGRRTKGF